MVAQCGSEGPAAYLQFTMDGLERTTSQRGADTWTYDWPNGYRIGPWDTADDVSVREFTVRLFDKNPEFHGTNMDKEFDINCAGNPIAYEEAGAEPAKFTCNTNEATVKFRVVQEYSLPWARQQALAEKFSPILYYHPDDPYVVMPVEATLEHSDLMKKTTCPGGHGPKWCKKLVDSTPTAQEIAGFGGDHFLKRQVPNTCSGVLCTVGQRYAAYYQDQIRHDATNPPTVYARVVSDATATGDARIVVQYWFHLWFNDWNNKHENDWEGIMVIVRPDETVDRVMYWQHYGGDTRNPTTEDVRWEKHVHPDGTHSHLVTYVAKDSHASYFTTSLGETLPDVTRGDGTRLGLGEYALPIIDGTEPWLQFNGRWGARPCAAVLCNWGGHGPSEKGDKWNAPVRYAEREPGPTG